MSLHFQRCQLARIFIVVAILSVMCVARAQTAETSKVRFSPVSIDATMMSRISDLGSLTAVLSGRNLTIKGTFAGLKLPAADAHIHLGSKGIQGPPVLDLPVSKGTSGIISVLVELTPEQVEELRNSSLYI
jgi:hypothetical protein